MNEIDAQKALLRQRASAARRVLASEQKKALNQAVFQQILHFKPFQNADVIFLYASLPDEVDTIALTKWCLAHKKVVCFPVCLPGHQMAFMPISDLNELIPAAYGIPAPAYCESDTVIPANDSLCLVPALAVDYFGNRLGYGGGYYDRWLQNNRILTAALCFENNLQSKIPAGEYDIPVDFIITEKQCISAHHDVECKKEVT